MINVTRGDATVPFGATALNKDSGVSRVSLILDHSFYNASTGLSSGGIDIFDSFDPFGKDHFSARDITFGEETGAGTYHITGAYVTDKANNQTYYSEAQLNVAGIDTTFKVVDKSALSIAFHESFVASDPGGFNERSRAPFDVSHVALA